MPATSALVATSIRSAADGGPFSGGPNGSVGRSERPDDPRSALGAGFGSDWADEGMCIAVVLAPIALGHATGLGLAELGRQAERGRSAWLSQTRRRSRRGGALRESPAAPAAPTHGSVRRSRNTTSH